jgi:hypothetical protein
VACLPSGCAGGSPDYSHKSQLANAPGTCFDVSAVDELLARSLEAPLVGKVVATSEAGAAGELGFGQAG